MTLLTIRIIMTASQQLETESKRRRRRKSHIHTVTTPLKRLAPKRERRTRSVYILARPIKKAGHLGFLSEGKFPLCHWSLLVSPYNQRELKNHIRQGIDSWGTIFEICNSDGTHVPNVYKHSPQIFVRDWGYVCLAYVGKAHLPDYRISHHGLS
jgi:hypothetical protein